MLYLFDELNVAHIHCCTYTLLCIYTVVHVYTVVHIKCTKRCTFKYIIQCTSCLHSKLIFQKSNVLQQIANFAMSVKNFKDRIITCFMDILLCYKTSKFIIFKGLKNQPQRFMLESRLTQKSETLCPTTNNCTQFRHFSTRKQLQRILNYIYIQFITMILRGPAKVQSHILTLLHTINNNTQGNNGKTIVIYLQLTKRPYQGVQC